MVISGNTDTDESFRRRVIQLYWSLTSHIAENTTFEPTDRLIITAIEIQRLTPDAPAGLRIAEIADTLDLAPSTVRGRCQGLEDDGHLLSQDNRYSMREPESLEPVFRLIEHLLLEQLAPIARTINASSPEPTLPLVFTNRRQVRKTIAELFLNISLATAQQTGLPPEDRYILLAIIAHRRSGAGGGPGIRSLSRALEVPKTTVSRRVKSMTEAGILCQQEDGLNAEPAIVDFTYNLIVDNFITRAAPIALGIELFAGAGPSAG